VNLSLYPKLNSDLLLFHPLDIVYIFYIQHDFVLVYYQDQGNGFLGYAMCETNLDKLFCLRQNMAMLITERAILTPQRTTRVRSVPQVVELPESVAQPIPAATELVSSLPKPQGLLFRKLSALGDRQSWLLLGLVFIPVVGAVLNFMTYGFVR
jgi:hypothetical protein